LLTRSLIEEQRSRLFLNKQSLKQSASHISRSKMSHKTVTSERASFTKAEREYVKGVVHNLSLQRLTDRQIVRWLHDEKRIDLERSTISKMRASSRERGH
ncbi:MAG: hypothetical protein WB975_09480, partial [Nitrososphaeraceae archaeon]